MSAGQSKVRLPRDKIADFCHRHHIRKLAVFGSVLHGDSRPDSDLDALVEFEPGHVPGLAFFALEIVGEPASRVPARERAEYPGIPWARIVGLRNRLIHGYDSVDFDILWQILTQDLPPPIAQLEKTLLPGPQS